MRNELIIGTGLAYWEEINGEAVLLEYDGDEARVNVPTYVEKDGRNIPITIIGKKAFMGKLIMKEVSLPATIVKLEDWAFANCSHLELFSVREGDGAQKPELGKGVFEGCKMLESIAFGYEKKDDMSVMLAALVWRLPATYLFMDPDVGRLNWYENWDKALVNFLNQKDDDGYTDRVLCGEEDISYDGIGSVDGELLSDGTNYVIETRKRKAVLCFLRLMHSSHLKDIYRTRFVEYILEHNIDKKSKEGWLVLKEELGGKIEYFKLFEAIGGISTELTDAMITDLAGNYAEAKAYLISLKSDAKEDDFFDKMLL